MHYACSKLYMKYVAYGYILNPTVLTLPTTHEIFYQRVYWEEITSLLFSFVQVGCRLHILYKTGKGILVLFRNLTLYHRKILFIARVYKICGLFLVKYHNKIWI